MDRLKLLKQISFGSRIAEDEIAELSRYFVETDQWTRISNGEIDIVRGDKGSGKSAVYFLLIAKTDDFFDQNILLVTAENPRGTTVFKDLTSDPPTSEAEFIVLWKLYILTLIGKELREFGITGQSAKEIYAALEDAGFLEREISLSGVLRVVQNYARKLLQAEAIEGGVTFDQNTGVPTGVTGKILLRDLTARFHLAHNTSSAASALHKQEKHVALTALILCAATYKSESHALGGAIWAVQKQCGHFTSYENTT
jgi:hypothetical protein